MQILGLAKLSCEGTGGKTAFNRRWGRGESHLNWPRRVIRSGYVEIDDKVLLNLP